MAEVVGSILTWITFCHWISFLSWDAPWCNLPIYFRQELKESRHENRNLKEQMKNIQENSHSQQQLTDAEIITFKSLALQQDISSQTIVKSVVTGSEEPQLKIPRT